MNKNIKSSIVFNSGHIHLFDIYKFVAEYPKLVSGKDGDMHSYTKVVNQITQSIPVKAGWYNWGHFNNVGFWETIYFGKTGNKKTSSLKARIKEEILDERGAFWATIYGSEPTEKQFQKMTKNKYGSGVHMYRKSNTHFIVWVSADNISEEGVKREEEMLIALYRPSFNVQRKIKYPSHIHPHTKKILEIFDREIAKINNPRI